MIVLAAALIVGEGLALLALFRVVKSFGAYVAAEREFKRAILAAAESNLLVHAQNQAILQELRRTAQKEVA